ncbi:MAG: metallophosphoesterase family protein [Bacilli bacterium]|nr:metallophosphoesterase family protein [Bacilli bacterium]
MRIAIFSDIHGNKEALTAIIEDIKKENIDEVICLGDTIGIGPNPKECLDLIINNNIKMVFRKL